MIVIAVNHQSNRRRLERRRMPVFCSELWVLRNGEERLFVELTADEMKRVELCIRQSWVLGFVTNF